MDLITELSNKLQFTFDVYEVEDKAWGGKSKGGEWNGLMKDLITNKADLAMTSLKVTTERSLYIDFTVPFMETVMISPFLNIVYKFFNVLPLKLKKGIAIVVSTRPGTISTTAFLS